MREVTLVLLTLLLVGESIPAQVPAAARWPQFRGPNGSGVADADAPPIQFGSSVRLVWKVDLPPGHSSPIVWDDHIFLTAVENEKLMVMALRRRDGGLRWKQIVPGDAIEKVHPFSSAASSTPATDGVRVYVYVGSFGLLAYDFDGKDVWRRPLTLPPTKYGTATSPIVFGGKVIVQRDGNSADSEILAVDARTGADAWRAPRPTLQESWSTPMLWDHGSTVDLVTVGNGRVVAYSPNDGVERWRASGLTFQPITIAVSGGGLLFASATGTGAPGDSVDVPSWESLVQRYDANRDGQIAPSEVPEDVGVVLRKEVPKETPGNYMPIRSLLTVFDANHDGLVNRGEWDSAHAFVAANEDTVMAIRPGGGGDVTNTHVVWKAKRGISEIPSPIFYRGRLYFVRSGGLVTSYAPERGEVVLDKQRLGVLGQYCASPVAADGRIYAASETGTVVVFRAGDTLEVLARNELGESIVATPAIAGNTLYVRTSRHLWAFGD
jgi:outer membrane protein assembly factor BamB